MSLKNKFFSFLTVALSMVVFSAFTMAQDAGAAPEGKMKGEKRMRGDGHGGWGKHGGKRGMHHGMHRGFRMLHAANLTDAQKAQVKVIMEANKPNAAVREEVMSLRSAKRAGTLTADQQARLTQIREDRQANAKLVHEQIMAILTPEQRAQIEQKKAEMKQKRQERRQKRQQVETTNLDG